MNRANLVLHAKASIDRGSKSFALASKLFAKQTRERVWLLYAWCRECDDLADGQDHGHEMKPVTDPKRIIAMMRMLTNRAMKGEQTGKPAFDAIGVVAQECRLPDRFAHDVIDGFALDAQGWQPQSEDDLYQYCYHVAGAVGCMMAVVMGVPVGDDETLDRACDLGLAFQLSNIARDVAEDARAGRCYLPKNWLTEQDIDPDNILADSHRSALIPIIARLCDLAQQYAASARTGAAQLPFRSRWAVLAAAGIYGDIARGVKQSEGAALDQRIITSKAAKLMWVVKALGQAIGKPKFVDRKTLWNRRASRSLS
ncbi:phytoene/squalene synthase family protein [Parasphingorhabdus sp. JC815]|uniref:phytoene/squalene synthase family protein n=1 Tax=Parasphingorhabdus sp. JC815 TaxID=3232140 RepID=UPI00345B3010